MSSERVTGEQVIQRAEPGLMVYSRASTDGEHWLTVFLIREEKKYVPRERNPIIELRGGLLYQDAIPIVVCMLRIGAGKEAQLYETWFNFHGPENVESFYDLAAQEQLPIVFYIPERARSLQVRNGFKDLFTRTLAAVRTQKPWTMQAFDVARDWVYSRYPTPRELWQALDRIKSPEGAGHGSGLDNDGRSNRVD